MRTQPKFSLRYLLIEALIATILLIPVAAYFSSQSVVEVIQEQNELRVATRFSPSGYYTEDGEPGGFEYELAQLYAAHLGVQLKMISFSSLEEIYEALRLNNVHLAAAGLTVTAERQRRFTFGPAYLNSQTEVIYRSGSGGFRPRSLADLKGSRLEVVADSSHAEQLASLQPEGVSWATASADQEVLDLLQRVNDGELDFTLVDATEFRINRSYYPRLRSAFALTEPQPIAWMMKHQRDSSLQDSLAEFFADSATQASLELLKERHLSSDQRLNLVDGLTLRRHIRTRLPKLRSWFEAAAAETGLEWQLLAAIGYQESHWNPRAVSPTGVRGVMMLTQATARQLGIKQRTDPQQSIAGGARYFKNLKSRLPRRIAEPDLTYFALAAYNVGRGHLEDARILTQRAGKDPDRWDQVREFLPLLSQPKWYRTLKHGFARGQEPVVYVRNIQRYYRQLILESRRESISDQPEPLEAESWRMPEFLPNTL